MPDTTRVSPELSYVLLLFCLFVVPRFLQRYGIPTAITSLAIGVLSGIGFGLFVHDATIELLSTFGIVALFLFAGLDAEMEDLRRESRVIGEHVALRLALLGVATYLVVRLLGLETRPAILVGLALLTPSTGFILDSLDSLGHSERERFWIRSKAIATELVALGALFVTLQSTTFSTLALSALVLGAMILLLPAAFRAFAERVAPFAPKSEFAFLMMLAVVCAFATRELGVYYLVGAFVVGMAAQRFRERLPAMASEEMVHAVESFSTFFVPFYFFHAGLELRAEDFGLESLGAGLAFLAVAVPVRVVVVALHRRLSLGEPFASGARVAVAMLPTLVFTLVIAQILRDRFQVPRFVFGGLIVYTIANTLIPSLTLRLPPPVFDAPHVSHWGAAEHGAAPAEGGSPAATAVRPQPSGPG